MGQMVACVIWPVQETQISRMSRSASSTLFNARLSSFTRCSSRRFYRYAFHIINLGPALTSETRSLTRRDTYVGGQVALPGSHGHDDCHCTGPVQTDAADDHRWALDARLMPDGDSEIGEPDIPTRCGSQPIVDPGVDDRHVLRRPLALGRLAPTVQRGCVGRPAQCQARGSAGAARPRGCSR